MATDIQFLSIIMFAVNQVLTVFNIFDYILIGSRSILDYILALAYLKVSWNFIIRMIDPKASTSDNIGGNVKPDKQREAIKKRAKEQNNVKKNKGGKT